MNQQSTNNNQYSFQNPIPQKQILISKKLVEILTDSNLNWLHKFQTSIENRQGYQYIKQHSQNYLFILAHGLPSSTSQFDFLDLPGQTLHFYPQGFDPQLKNEQEKIQAFRNAPLNKQAQIMNKILNSQKYKNKQLIFVVHSFGSLIMAQYFSMFGSSRVIGIISIAQAPFRSYKILDQLLQITTKTIQDPSLQTFLQENAQIFFHGSSQNAKKNNFIPMKDKYEIISLLNCVPTIPNGLIHLRNTPKILKLIIYGTQDEIFENKNINEVGIYYSYVNKIDEKQDKFVSSYLQQKYKTVDPKTKTQIFEAQPRFVYYLQKGKHSVHFQSKFQKVIKKATDEYIDVIGMWQQQNKNSKKNLDNN